MTRSTEPIFDSLDALAHLPRVDLDPLEARQQLVRAQRRLVRGQPPLSTLDRCEHAALLALATAHLIWAFVRAVEIAGAHFG